MSRITILAEVGGTTGYHLHLKEVFKWLTHFGHFVSIRPLRTRFDNASIPTELKAHCVSTIQPEEWELLICPPIEVPTPGKKTLYWTMWESDELPGVHVEKVNMAEAVIVPSQWCRDTFLKSGVNKPIYVVPLGIDPTLFKYQPWPETTETIFAAAGRTSHGRERKGLDEVVRSFLAAFPYEPNVRLKIKVHADCSLPAINDSRIDVIQKHLTDEEVVGWLASAHCFVSAATGEGWGLWQHQASAVGRPVLAALYGGLREFLGPQNAYPIAYREMPTIGMWAGKWAQPDLGDLIEQMRWIHQNRGEAMFKGNKAATNVRLFSWQHSCDRLGSVMGAVGMTEPNPKLFATAVINQNLSYAPDLIPSVEQQALDQGWKRSELKVRVDQGPYACLKPQVIFNPTVILLDGKRFWFARRSSIEGGNRPESVIVAFQEDSETYQTIDLPRFKGDAFEDPRAVMDGENILLSYTRVSSGYPASQQVAILDKELKVLDQWHIDFGNNGCSPKAAKGPEKNWVWFKQDGCWHFIYWLEPMKVAKVEWGKPVQVFESRKINPRWRHGTRHGGGHPTRIGDEWFGFCHSLMPWYGRDRSRYFISAYAFSAKPPFEMTRLSREPFLRSEDVMGANPCSCVICGGAVLENDLWTLAVGTKDAYGLKITVPHRDVISMMDQV